MMPREKPSPDGRAEDEPDEGAVDGCEALPQSARRSIGAGVSVWTGGHHEGTDRCSREQPKCGAGERTPTWPRIYLKAIYGRAWC